MNADDGWGSVRGHDDHFDFATCRGKVEAQLVAQGAAESVVAAGDSFDIEIVASGQAGFVEYGSLEVLFEHSGDVLHGGVGGGDRIGGDGDAA